MRYRLLAAYSSSHLDSQVEDLMNAHVTDTWRLHGPPIIVDRPDGCEPGYFQAVVKDV